jgi:hypothetical protein
MGWTTIWAIFAQFWAILADFGRFWAIFSQTYLVTLLGNFDRPLFLSFTCCCLHSGFKVKLFSLS